MSSISTLFVTDADGRIIKCVSGPETQIVHQEESQDDQVPGLILPGAYPANVASTHYVSGQRLVERPTMTLQVQGMKVSGIPVGAVLTIEGRQYPCHDGMAELSFAYPGRYRIGVACWPYRETSIEVCAV